MAQLSQGLLLKKRSQEAQSGSRRNVGTVGMWRPCGGVGRGDSSNWKWGGNSDASLSEGYRGAESW